MSASATAACCSFAPIREMNAWLLDKCVAHAKVHHHPELTEQTIWEVFEAGTA